MGFIPVFYNNRSYRRRVWLARLCASSAQQKYSFFKASVIQGLIWAFWHTVLWFVDSDFSGWQIIPYVLSNIIVMTGLCFIMNFFMKKHDNLIYGIAVHFCFNFLYCFLKVDIFFYIVLSILYLVIIGLICRRNKVGFENSENKQI